MIAKERWLLSLRPSNDARRVRHPTNGRQRPSVARPEAIAAADMLDRERDHALPGREQAALNEAMRHLQRERI
jgi:hypothetical protein